MAKHPGPAVRPFTEQVIDQVGDQDADGDHELVQGDQGSAQSGRGYFRNVQGDGEGGRADGQPEGAPPDHEQPDPGRQAGGQGAQKKDGRRPHDDPAPAEAIGQSAAESRAQDGPDQDRTDDQFLGQGAEAEILADEQQGSGYDPGVEPEQQSANGRYQGHHIDLNSDRLLPIRHEKPHRYSAGPDCAGYPAYSPPADQRPGKEEGDGCGLARPQALDDAPRVPVGFALAMAPAKAMGLPGASPWF